MQTELIETLAVRHNLTDAELKTLITERTPEDTKLLMQEASAVRDSIYGKKVFMRGLIEFTSYCRNDCYYCGLRRSNCNAERYRLSDEEIIACAENGYELGFRTFVLQGGEDNHFNDERLCALVSELKRRFPDCAVTISVGERSFESYKKLRDAGADRYLLRHETADPLHYSKLHPEEQTLETRLRALGDLKKLGFQTGCGFMVGSPHQTVDSIVKDLRLIRSLSPEMVGIGPFIPHSDTPFKDEKAGSVDFTLFLMAIVRLLLPEVLLPATTALGTIAENGRELGIKAGANVVMPNLSPVSVRKKYALYDNKISTGTEAAENVAELRRRVESVGYSLVSERGDHISRAF